ncbi:nucleotidyltransferase domain-containing protein [Candidatus Poribacteria bacterium]|jgi:predicted nucleotidyltransferase|nr:nucleotidyltransferase domain-containing protein [Candidatus Poribacteria bacterium]MBT5536446.1 nucleotidyltransferase domain-containing protein [Candidatus Poribacteria bacterium]MBT5714854.1 nucleotidyltransferase domain-containing protein [Candidatus Poribacteria bacterium]MBT7098454.1 nucleotidyltransferase domain-containing protein [Candidatus Poribacteria bacterium]MBT7805729.1 nucleotidyltransferase domain-containing protein [Candidatus Poribacteria bacterium]
MSGGRLEIARAFSCEQIDADPHIIAVFVIGSAARGDGVEFSDIDIRLIVATEADTGARHTLREGHFLDVERVHPPTVGDAEALLADPYLAGAVREAVILYDRDGRFTEVQGRVAAEFAEPQWLRARLSTLVDKVDVNRAKIAVAIEADDHVEIVRQGAFALWNLSDALLVSQGWSPSWVRGLQKLGQALPLERDRIVAIENSASMSADDVAALLPFFGDPGDSGVLSHVRREIEWMIGAGLHREAFHSLWAEFALRVGGLMATDERWTRARCRDWLERIGWCGDALPDRERRVEECATRLRRRLDAIG